MIKLNKKLCSLLLAVSLSATAFILTPITADAKSSEDEIIDSILETESVWSKYWYDSAPIFIKSYITFADLNFDGKNEFIVSYPCGSMMNVDCAVYYYTDGKFLKAGGGDKSKMISGYSLVTPKLSAYFDYNTGKNKILGRSNFRSSAADYIVGDYVLSFNGKDLDVNYYSAYSMSYPSGYTYYDGALGYGKLGDANEISETRYNEINDSIIDNCVDINFDYEKIMSSDWKYYSDNQKRSALKRAYENFKYDNYVSNLIGDANQDGIVNVNDVTYLQMHIAGNKNTDGSAFIDETNKQLFDCIDMNKDGKLSVADVTALQIYISQNN
ncbi:dockerin type I repeat-containing protein [Ruminococcus intestinalis]|uniref:dockerin type I repeat-containing protein n=1 Tax=Ruminococcus intestinalis TaxID=2763066 RepID=UPI003F7EAD93